MDLRQQILDTPRALRETFEKGRPEFESLIRRVRWGDGSIFMVGAGSSYIATLTGAHAFETLLGWPVVARPSVDFESYGLAVLRPRSVVLALSNSGETAETLDAARSARTRGAVVLAMTNNPASQLAQMADLALLLHAGSPSESGLQTILCQHAALGYLSWVAALTLKRHHQQLDVWKEEFAKLPDHVEWIQTHFADAVRALASELKGLRNLTVVGGGFYYPVALEAAVMLTRLAHAPAEGKDVAALQGADLPLASEDSAVLLLSGSHCRLKKKIHAVLAQAKQTRERTYAVTDNNDRELSRAAKLSILLPELSEMTGSILTLALLQSVASQMARSLAREVSHTSAPPLPGEGDA
jgi:glucosamine--fructose-6-phosphate aminotransferase (isomerizing)